MTYKKIVSPILDRFDSEMGHVLAREALHLAERFPGGLRLTELFAYGRKRYAHEKLRTALGDISFDNPLLVGAGWDKQGQAVKALWQLGFAGVEVGSVLADPQPGNPKPRQFILAPGVVLNRLGFNSPGRKVVAKNLQRYAKSGIPIGISIGKNKELKDIALIEAAHAIVAEELYPYAAYFVINVSSPNTPGLRALQDKEPLKRIVQAVIEGMERRGERKPLFVKIAPELTRGAIDDVIEVSMYNEIAGIIAVNTTINEGIKAKYGERWRNAPGGLSGDDADFRAMATEKIAYIFKAAGERLKVIGVGGIKDTATALEKIMAGASMLQIVTAIRGEGPTVAGRINRGLVEFMESEGVSSIYELVGAV